jgi:hypothetical protein
MKSNSNYLNTLITLWILSSLLSLTACQPQRKSEDRPGVAGNVYSDGSLIVTRGFINGTFLDIEIGQFETVNVDPSIFSYTNGTGYSYNPLYNFNALQFGIAINGSAKLFATPFLTGPQNSLGNTGINSMTADTWDLMEIRYQARCLTADCEIHYLNVIILQNNSAKQIGIKRSRSQNLTLSVIESSGAIEAMKTTEQLISDLNLLK